MNQIPVSVVIPCYNCADTIERAVASVARQTSMPADVILVDDASTDDTLSVLYALRAQYGRAWVRVIALARNAGPGAARNMGWGASTQSYVAFLDADDTWHADKLGIQAAWMMQHPDAALTGHMIGTPSPVDAGSRPLGLDAAGVAYRRVTLPELLAFNRFSTPTVIVRRDVPYRFEEKRYSEDYGLWCRICAAGLACYEVAVPLAYCHKSAYGASGLSARLWKMQRGELGVYRALRRQGLISRLTCLRAAAWSMLKFFRRLLIVGGRTLYRQK